MISLLKLYYTFRLHILLSAGKSVELKKSSQKRCYIFLAADYGNLGDVAITHAQKKFLQNHYPNHEVVAIPASKTIDGIKRVKGVIGTDDIVTVVGGGNMGDMYADIELLRLLVVKSFPDNRIILFPQTISYSKTGAAKWLKQLSKKIYSRHTDLLMTAREKFSFEIMKALYPSVNVALAPDIVMSLEERLNLDKRENLVTLCLRNDLEKKDNSGILYRLKNTDVFKDCEVEEYDTHIGNIRLTEEKSQEELFRLWNQFKRSKFIITDRLHGMIFAFITGTPAVVLPNSNFKIEGCYEWLRQCGYIKMIKDDNPIDLSFISKAKNESAANLQEWLSSQLVHSLIGGNS